MIDDPNFRKNLVVSILTSVIVLIFIDPLLKFTATWLMSLGTNLSTSWTNGIYRSAALGLREKFSFLILAFIVAMWAGAAAGAISATILRGREKPKQKINRWIEKPVFAIIFSVLLIGAATDELVRNFAELQLNASFNQRITVLAVKASDQQIKNLRASWALMEGRKDYESINLEMQKIETELKIKLPAPLWE